jgi:hypothetical protein
LLSDLFRKKIEIEQSKYLAKFELNKNNEIRTSIKVNNYKLYEKYPDMPKQEIKTNNEHQDLANFRLYFEWLNMKFSIIATKSKIIIDVGCSTRLYHSMIARVVLRPVLSVVDSSRQAKLIPNHYVIISENTIQDFVKHHEQDIKTNDVVLNFTDVLYYISPYDLLLIFKDFKDGLVGTGTIHIFNDLTSNQSLVGLGYVTQDEELHYMKVIGNESTYVHKAYYTPLLTNDMYIIKGIDYNISILKKATVDLEATIYMRVEIIKTTKQEFSRSFFKLVNLEEQEKEEDSKKLFNIKQVERAILEYKTDMKLSYQQIASPQHIMNIRARLNLTVPETDMFSVIRESIIKLSLVDSSE